jgi:hypothetical protein
VTVTLDLLGRRVLLADQRAADGVTGITNHSATPGFSMGSTTDALQQGQQGVTTGATTTTTTAASSSSSRGVSPLHRALHVAQMCLNMAVPLHL